MFLPLYTLAAIANIIAKSHNFNINHELHPYLRVRRSTDNVKFTDVKLNEIETEPDYNLEGDIDVNWLSFEDPANPLETDKVNLSSGKQENDESGVLRIPNEEIYEQKYSAASSRDAVNTHDEALHDQRQKRSFYLPISMPVFNEAKSTTTQGNRLSLDVSNTTEDSPTTSTQITLFDTDNVSDYDYDNSDYENGGHFIARRPITVDISTNKTESYNPSSEVNWTKNKTQAYYPLSHTYIPGYNTPDDVFNFEKGPVYTNTTNNSKENKTFIIDNKSENVSNPLKVDANSTDSKINSKRIKNYNRKDSFNFKETNSNSNTNNEQDNNFEDENNVRRVKRSYYMAVPNRGKAGQSQSYYPLSHTYIPGYNSQEEVFKFEGGPVVPVPNKKTHIPNKPKRGDNPLHSNNKDEKKPEATTKRTTLKNQQRTTRSPQNNYEKTTPKNQVTPKPSNSRPTIDTKNNQKPNDGSDYSLDYENNGEFIVHDTRNGGRSTQQNWPKPNNNRPQLNKNIRQGYTTRKTKDSDEDDSYEEEEDYRTRKLRKHLIVRQKRSYYMPIYGTDSNGRKKVTGYHPLSHTYIPGYNEQDDVWNFEGGKVYPYPSSTGGDEGTYTEVPNSHRQGNEKQKPTKDENKNVPKPKNEKHDSLLDTLLINPLKKLFGKRKKRSINIIQKNHAKIVQKRNSITDFLNNMVEKIENYTRRDQVVVIDTTSSAMKTNELNYIPDTHGNEYNGQNLYNRDSSNWYNQNNYKKTGNYQETGYKEQLYQNNPQNGYNTPYNYQNGYSPYASDYQSRYHNQGAYNISNKNVYFPNNTNINENYLPQSASGGSEESDSEKEGNLRISCFICRSSGCPINTKRLGRSCVPIK